MVQNLSVNNMKDIKVDKRLIHNLVKKLSEELKFKIAGIQINFVNSDEIMRINREYLNHNFSTDVITFDYSGSQTALDGEIYISVDVAASNAKRYRISLKKEIIRLIIHSFLHLLGFDDQSQKEKTVMKKLENKLFSKYSLLIKGS